MRDTRRDSGQPCDQFLTRASEFFDRHGRQAIEGRSFRELADETGVGLNTLLSRKRYAVLYLRRRLQAIYDEYLKP